MYRQQRNYHNLQRRMYDGVGVYGIPEIQRQDIDIDGCRWVDFNSAVSCENPGMAVCHFFLDDYRFERVWQRPDDYIPLLKRFKAVTAPDFSLYADFPVAVQVFNHWRKHWLGAYWQEHGVNVIPTACWADNGSFEWCFDGEPRNGAVAISDVGTLTSAQTRERFYVGFDEMMDRLEPDRVMLYTSTLDLQRFDDRTKAGSSRIVVVPNSNVERLNAIRKSARKRRRKNGRKR